LVAIFQVVVRILIFNVVSIEKTDRILETFEVEKEQTQIRNPKITAFLCLCCDIKLS
jgi:ABC-type uncharacterized transport system permease subunit